MNLRELSITQLLAVGTVMTVVISAIYVIAYSITSGFPVFIYVSSNDFLVISFSWALPVVLGSTFILFWQSTNAKKELALPSDSKPGLSAGSKAGKKNKLVNREILLILFTWAVLETIFVFISETTIWTTAPLWAMFWWEAIWEYANFKEMPQLFSEVFGPHYYVATFYLPLLILFSASVGLSDGATARRYIWGSPNSTIIMADSEVETTISGRVAFDFQDFLVVREAQDWNTIVINKSLVKQIRTVNKSDEQLPIIAPQDSLLTPGVIEGIETESR